MDRQAALPGNGWRMMNEGRQDGRLIRKKPLIANIVLCQQFSDEQRKNETGHTSDCYGIIDSNYSSETRDPAIMVSRNLLKFFSSCFLLETYTVIVNLFFLSSSFNLRASSKCAILETHHLN